MARDDLIAYAFPCDGGIVGKLYLPRQGLTRADATRLKEYVEALVTFEPEAAGTPRPHGSE